MNKKLGGLGHAAEFQLQYMPEFGKTTEMGSYQPVPAGKGLGNACVWVWPSCALVGLLTAASSFWYLQRTPDGGALWGAVEQVSTIWKPWETCSVLINK